MIVEIGRRRYDLGDKSHTNGVADERGVYSAEVFLEDIERFLGVDFSVRVRKTGEHPIITETSYEVTEYNINASGERGGDERVMSWGFSLGDAIGDADRYWNHLPPEIQKRIVVEVRCFKPGTTRIDDYNVIYRNGALVK